jgi:TonB family protein
MKLRLKRNSCLIFAAALLGAGAMQAWPQTDSPTKPVSLGAQAVAVVLKHYAINPYVLHPTMRQPLAVDGTWSISKTRPASCPQTDDKCVEVIYDVPVEHVRCSWVLQLNAEAADGIFLDENDDASTYLLRVVPKAEAIPLVITRANAVYPPIAIAARVAGDVLIKADIDKLGALQNARVLSGNAMLQYSSIEAAKKWTFKPLMVGAKAVPYQVKLVFKFQLIGEMRGFESVKGDLAP